MATIWKQRQKYESQTGITYNEADDTYNEEGISYSGKITSSWSNRTKN